MAETPVTHLLAQYYECPPEAAAALWAQSIAAWKQAMAEFGIADHPGGKCPAPDCQCSPLSELVTARAYELLRLSGWEDADG
jgi:hypothetical protein